MTPIEVHHPAIEKNAGWTSLSSLPAPPPIEPVLTHVDEVEESRGWGWLQLAAGLKIVLPPGNKESPGGNTGHGTLIRV